MENNIITISRQFGSGGRTIGKFLARRLNIPCLDYEIIEKLSLESGFNKEFIAEKSEYSDSKGFLAGNFITMDYNGLSIENEIWKLQNKIIIEEANKGPCVIVGRCADYILRGKHNILSVFIHADIKKRIDRVIRVYGERSDSIEKRILEKDKRREAYYNYYTDKRWGDIENYDLCIDAGKLGIDLSIEILKMSYERFIEQKK